VQPSMAVIMETEIWPSLYCACGERHLPLFLANARLSRQSEAGYGPIVHLVSMALGCVWGIAAQAEADASRLINLGADPRRVRMVNSLKFDIDVEQSIINTGNEFKRNNFAGRCAWIAASTHEGDEEIILDVHKELLDTFPDLLLILVPRHPERFDRAADLCEQSGIETVSRSSDQPLIETTQCYLADTLGELLMLYQAADVAFVGGSFSDVGGHNVLEPAALGKPVLFGPYIFNFEEICQTLLDGGGAIQVAQQEQLLLELKQLFLAPQSAEEIGKNAANVVREQRGAVAKTLTLIEEVIAQESPCITD
ncbi:MAG: 3-deoxy-D-manno-octulosonic acid transferase, partial [bacterium]